MSFRRPLSDMLGDVAGGALDGAGDSAVSITEMEFDLPVELRLSDDGPDAQLLGDVPLFLTRTAFDAPVSRLSVHWLAGEVER